MDSGHQHHWSWQGSYPKNTETIVRIRILVAAVVIATSPVVEGIRCIWAQLPEADLRSKKIYEFNLQWNQIIIIIILSEGRTRV